MWLVYEVICGMVAHLLSCAVILWLCGRSTSSSLCDDRKWTAALQLSFK
jgi:hypothetical protein